MLRTFNTSLLAFFQAIAVCLIMVLFLPVELHNRLLLTVVLIAPIWLIFALWVTQKEDMKKVFLRQVVSLLVMALLIWLGLTYA